MTQPNLKVVPAPRSAAHDTLMPKKPNGFRCDNCKRRYHFLSLVYSATTNESYCFDCIKTGKVAL